jgi:hypothetical protein
MFFDGFLTVVVLIVVTVELELRSPFFTVVVCTLDWFIFFIVVLVLVVGFVIVV